MSLHYHAAATLQIFFFGVIAVYIKVSLFANSLDKTSIDHRLSSPPAHQGLMSLILSLLFYAKQGLLTS